MNEPQTERGLEWALAELMGVWGRQFQALQQVLQGGSTELLESFSHIHEFQDRWAALAPGDEAGRAALLKELGQASERALHGLQFADRLGQMLSVLQGDVSRLQNEVGSLRDADPAKLQRWLDDLAAHYTTDEQREQHASMGHGRPAEAGNSGVDFF